MKQNVAGDLIATLYNTKDKKNLEQLGNTLTVQSAHTLLNAYPSLDATHTWKISAVLAGIPPTIFYHMLASCSPGQLHALQIEGASEPLQHQLTLLQHTAHRDIYDLCNAIDVFEQDIQQTLHTQITLSLLHAWDAACARHQHALLNHIALIDAALTVAWHTDRIDLIEKYSEDKEILQRYSSLVIGAPEKGALYPLVAAKLRVTYGKPSDVDMLNDDEPAIEGLAKLALWDLGDYWEVGLLPRIREKRELHPKDAEARAALFHEVVNNLSTAGLNTVGDLKKAGICSAETLKNYLTIALKT